MFIVEIVAAIVITASLMALVEADTRDNRVRVTRAPD